MFAKKISAAVLSAIGILILSSCFGVDEFGDDVTGLWRVAGMNICEDGEGGMITVCNSGNYAYMEKIPFIDGKDIDGDQMNETVTESMYFELSEGGNTIYFKLEVDDPGEPLTNPVVDPQGNEYNLRNAIIACDQNYMDYDIDEGAQIITMYPPDSDILEFRYEFSGDNAMTLFYVQDETQYIDMIMVPNGVLDSAETDCAFQFFSSGSSNNPPSNNSNTSFTLSYDGNGATSGIAPANPQVYNVGDVVNVPGNTGNWLYYQDGITPAFKGWNTKNDGMGTSYDAGDTFPMPAANLTLYAIYSIVGGTGPGGGYVFYDQGYYSNGWRYMEAAPSDYTGYIWGCEGTSLAGNPYYYYTYSSIGSGFENTATIVSGYTASGCGTGGNAAYLCTTLNFSGLTGWFLPSSDELALIYTNLHLNNIGGFNADINVRYWSSTEDGADQALVYAFSGYPSYLLKSANNGLVRAARRF